jgi:hypothetical protein
MRVSFDTASLFANVPVEVLQIIRNKLLDDTLAEHLVLEVDAIMELLEVCRKTTNFQLTGSSTKKRAWLWGALSFQ